MKKEKKNPTNCVEDTWKLGVTFRNDFNIYTFFYICIFWEPSSHNGAPQFLSLYINKSIFSYMGKKNCESQKLY